MSCERSRAAYHARIAADSGVATAFGGVSEAEQALGEIYAVARAQAGRKLAAREGDQSRLAQLRAQAEDQQAADATRALFADMRDRFGLRPPAHAASGLPRKEAQYGYAAVYRTLQAIVQRLALPDLARQVRDAMQRRRTLTLPQDTGRERDSDGRPCLPISFGSTSANHATTSDSVVQVSASAARREYDHALMLRNVRQRRLQHLQLKEAQFGIACDPSVLMEIEDLGGEIATLNERIAAYAQVPTIPSALLTPEQQRAALLALSAIVGLPPERIKLIDIVLGSIVLVVELPIAEAGRLLALQRLGPQALARSGFARVDVLPLHRTFATALARATEEAEAQLADPAAPALDPHAAPALLATVRLRVTLAEG